MEVDSAVADAVVLTDADVDVCCAVSETEDAEVDVELVVEVVVVAGVVASGVGVGVGVVGAAVVEGAAGAVVAPNVRPGQKPPMSAWRTLGSVAPQATAQSRTP